MVRFQDVVTSQVGTPLPGAFITVRNSPSGTLASIAADNGTTLPNPLTADGSGAYYFNAPVGLYSLEFRLISFEPARKTRVIDLDTDTTALAVGLFVNSATFNIPLGVVLLQTSGYSAVDKGSGVYVFDAAVNSAYVAAHPLSSFLYSDGRGFRLSLEQDITLEMFGAVGDGVTDDTAAILAAIATAGGTVRGSLGKTYKIASTLVLSVNGAKLIGPGAGDNHDTGTAIVAPCRLLWGGASGGTMVQVKSASTQYIAGNEFRGIFLDGNNGLAAVGLNVVGGRLGTYEVVGAHFTTALLKMDPDTALSEPQGCSENVIERLSGYQTNVGDGSLLIETSTTSFNCSQNQFRLISGDFRNGYAIDVQGSDSEDFQNVKLFGTQVTCVGIRFKAGATVLQTARNNKVGDFALSGTTAPTTPILAEGTGDATVASYGNRIDRYDDDSNSNLPVVHTGASLSWGSIKAGIGLRSYAPVVGGTSVRQEATGLIIQSGLTTSIASAGNLAITLAKALPSGATSVQVTPRTAGMALHADCTSTVLTIHNDGASATDFFWRVEGV